MSRLVKYDHLISGYRKKSAPLEKGIYESDAKIFLRTKKAVCVDAAKGSFKTIEASIMDVADDIAYSTYDLEDTFKSGVLDPFKVLSADRSLLAKVAQKVSQDLGIDFEIEDCLSVLLSVFDQLEDSGSVSPVTSLESAVESSRASSRLASDGYLRTKFTADLVSEFLARVSVTVIPELPQMSSVYLEGEPAAKVACLKHFTYYATIMSPRLRVSERRGFDIVKRLFKELDSEKGYLLMPEDFRHLYEAFPDEASKKRVVCDFIAGMTDRYAVEFYGRIFSEHPQSIFKPF